MSEKGCEVQCSIKNIVPPWSQFAYMTDSFFGSRDVLVTTIGNIHGNFKSSLHEMHKTNA
jgi:hypothetical protein